MMIVLLLFLQNNEHTRIYICAHLRVRVRASVRASVRALCVCLRVCRRSEQQFRSCSHTRGFRHPMRCTIFFKYWIKYFLLFDVWKGVYERGVFVCLCVHTHQSAFVRACVCECVLEDWV
jgi:hypothetical protein